MYFLQTFFQKGIAISNKVVYNASSKAVTLFDFTTKRMLNSFFDVGKSRGLRYGSFLSILLDFSYKEKV